MAPGNFGDVGIKGRHHPIEGLDHRHLTAKSRVDIGELQTDVAAADDRDPAGQPFQIDGLVTGEHRSPIGLDAGWNEGIGAGRQDHVLGRQNTIHAAGFTQPNPLRAFDTSDTPQDRHPGPFEGLGQVGADRLHQLIGVIGDLLPLETHGCGVDSETGEMLVIGQFANLAAGSQQRLGRHTTTVHTGATHVARFDDRRFKAMLSRMLCGIKPAVAGTDDNDVEVEAGVAHPVCCDVAVIVALRRSSRRGTAAAATFSDSTRLLWGSVTAWLQQA